MSLPASPGGRRVTIGVDFGTESGRVLLLDVRTGEELAVAEVHYRNGVIDQRLPSSGEELPPDTALQDPADYLEVLYSGIPEALAAGNVVAEEVIGIGVDFTCCTVLPVTEDGTPLCQLEEWRDRLHAWVKLWKHHSAQPVADRLNAVAVERGESFLARYGGRLSSEWYFPKLIEIWQKDRAVYDAMSAFVEATDWIVWQLTGSLVRASCSTGYKACWSATEGLPSRAFFEAAYPGFPDPSEKLGTTFSPPGHCAGTLGAEVAARLGLSTSVAVAVGNVDSFVSVPGAGVQDPGVFLMVVGTSICDLVIDRQEIRMPGITGVVEDGILPGFFGYEAGQAAVGDMFAWFGGRLLGLQSGGSGTGASWYEDFERAAAKIAPGASGLVALDWWNGNRTILGDADLSGVIAGLTLATTPTEIYRALLESVAFGTRRIIENFVDHGVAIDGIVACGGIAERSALMMQLLADVTGLPVAIPDSSQIPARGAALCGALAAGSLRGGYDEFATAVGDLTPAVSRRYEPSPQDHATYDEVYSVFASLHDELGRTHVEWLHQLKKIRLAVLASST
ncbi:MAG: ribulokinase [Acidimicrobiales bacterium]